MGDRTSRENPAGRVSPPRERVDGGDLVSSSTSLVKRRAAPKLPSCRTSTRPSFRVENRPRGRHVENDYIFPWTPPPILDLPSTVWHRRSTLSFVDVSTAHVSDPEGERRCPFLTLVGLMAATTE